ncbi:MAG: tetratricopeptide repeat protein [Pseudomonadota bacterium]
MDWLNRITRFIPGRGAKAQPAAASSVNAEAITAPRKNRLMIIGLSAALVLAALTGGGMWWAKSRAVVAAVPAHVPVKPILLTQAPAQTAVASAVVAEASAVAPTEKPAAPVGEPASASAVTQATPHVAEITPDANPGRAKQVAREKKPQHIEQEIALSDPPQEKEIEAAPPPVRQRAKPRAAAQRNAHNVTFIASAPSANALNRPLPFFGAPGAIDKQVKQLTAQQQAENQFRRASGLIQQGRVNDALAAYDAALQLDPGHDEARRAMVGVLLENKRNAEAEQVLQDALKFNPQNSALAMLLARLQVERDASWSALLTLQKTLPYAERQPEYQAFMAALLQRLNHPKEAIMRYQIALKMTPNSGPWLMGLGMSLQDAQRIEEARDAYRRALDSRTLTAELQAFVMQRMQELN